MFAQTFARTLGATDSWSASRPFEKAPGESEARPFTSERMTSPLRSRSPVAELGAERTWIPGVGSDDTTGVAFEVRHGGVTAIAAGLAIASSARPAPSMRDPGLVWRSPSF